MKNKIQLDAAYYFIMLMLGSTCFEHHYAHCQELTTIALVTTQAENQTAYVVANAIVVSS